VFTNQGTFVVEYFGTKITPKIPICCKVMEFGTLRPNLFSDHSKWNSTFTCDNFLGNNRTCDSYNLFGHGSMWIDSETRDPVKF
jgi:hypothetical protein